MPKEHVNIVLISIVSPLLVGVYHNSKLIEQYEKSEQSSDILPLLFEELLYKYEVEKVVYTNGPGSYMAIKLSYIFLKTLEIVKGIELLAVDGFYFNRNSPIKAVGKLFFHKDGDEISLKQEVNKDTISPFTLPLEWRESDFSKKVEPLYILPAV